MKAWSSRGAAKRLKVSLMTLQRYIAAKKITAPRVQVIGGVRVRLWTLSDIDRARKQMKKK